MRGRVYSCCACGVRDPHLDGSPGHAHEYGNNGYGHGFSHAHDSRGDRYMCVDRAHPSAHGSTRARELDRRARGGSTRQCTLR